MLRDETVVQIPLSSRQETINVLYSAFTHLFRVYVRTQNTPNPAPKHLVSWPELKSGQNELPSGKFGPQLGKSFEKWAKLF